MAEDELNARGADTDVAPAEQEPDAVPAEVVEEAAGLLMMAEEKLAQVEASCGKPRSLPLSIVMAGSVLRPHLLTSGSGRKASRLRVRPLRMPGCCRVSSR